MADTIAGEFGGIYAPDGLAESLRWVIDYRLDAMGDDIVRLTVAAVPIPAAVWLFGSGIGLLGFIRRKNL